MHVFYRLTLLSAFIASGSAVEQIATSFGGRVAVIELPGEAGISGITAAELLSAARRGARPAVVRALTPETRINAHLNGKPLVLNGCIAVGVTPQADPAGMAARLGLEVVGIHSQYVLFKGPAGNRLAALRSLPSLLHEGSVTWSEPVVVRKFTPRIDPTDPRFVDQWYLKNTAQVSGDVTGNDINVSDAWATVTGAGVRVGVVDTGVLLDHEDLVANIIPGEGYDFLDDDTIANPGTDPDLGHGTMCAGFIAAARNGTGLVGVAYGATIVPLRLLGEGSTTADTASALTWGQSSPTEVAISNNSWGPQDDGIDHGELDENPSLLEQTAFSSAVLSGRGGKGSIIVWACGNGGENQDSCDRDGYANSRYVIAVGATNGDGERSAYSEMGSCLFVNGPVGDSFSHQAWSTGCLSENQSIKNGYDSGVGTSFSTPMVCGVIALMLEARPALTWRDVRDLLAKTATKNDPTDPNWITNGAGLHWNLHYGFGRVDAAAAVAAAQDVGWATLPVEGIPLQVSASPQVDIPDPGSTASIPLLVSGNSLFRCETIEISLSATHSRQGDLAFTLTSPRGTTVTFLSRPNDTAAARLWVMSSVATWGENPNGTWLLTARDIITGQAGSLDAVTLTVHGHLTTTPGIGGGTATVVATPILSTSGSTTIPDPPPPVVTAPADEKKDSGSKRCGLGANGLGLMLAFGVFFVRFRRKSRR